MKISAPLIVTDGMDSVGFIDHESLSKKDKGLVAKVNDGHKAEVKLLEGINTQLAESEYTSAELEIDGEVGSYLRVATIDGVEIDEDGEASGSAIVTEVINGHLTDFMSTLNGVLEEKLDESNAEE